MDVHDRGMLYYRLLKHSVHEAMRVVCGQHRMVASKNTVIPRVCCTTLAGTSYTGNLAVACVSIAV